MGKFVNIRKSIAQNGTESSMATGAVFRDCRLWQHCHFRETLQDLSQMFHLPVGHSSMGLRQHFGSYKPTHPAPIS